MDGWMDGLRGREEQSRIPDDPRKRHNRGAVSERGSLGIAGRTDGRTSNASSFRKRRGSNQQLVGVRSLRHSAAATAPLFFFLLLIFNGDQGHMGNLQAAWKVKPAAALGRRQ